MFVYTGHSPVVKRYVAMVNDANSRGQILKLDGLNGNIPFRFLGWQGFNIAAFDAMRHPDKNFSYSSRSPKGERKAKEYRRAVKAGAILCSAYHNEKVRVRARFIPNDPNNKRVFEEDVSKTHAIFPGEGKAISYGLVVPHDEEYYSHGFNELVAKYGLSEFVCYQRDYVAFATLAEAEFIIRSGDNLGKDGVIYLDIEPSHSQDFTIGSLPSFWAQLQAPPATTLECVKRIRGKQADFLTAIAEMEETIKGLQSQVQRTYAWLRNLQEIATARRNPGKTLNRINADLARWAGLPLTDAHRRRLYTGSLKNYRKMLKREQTRLVKKEREIRKIYKHESVGDVTDRLSSHWLEAQYGVGPMIYTIVDLLEAIQRQRPPYQRAKVAWNPEFELPKESNGWTLESGENRVSARVWGKGRPRIETLLDDLNRYTKTNPLLTAWELIPLSFVVDWVINIGDALSTLGTEVFLQEAYMQGTTQKLSCTYTKAEPGGKIVLELEGFKYDRSFINIDERFILQPSWGLTKSNLVSGFSLLWAKVRGKPISKGILNG